MTSSTLVQVLVLMAAVASGPRMTTDAACPVADVYEPAPEHGTYLMETDNLHWPGEPENRSYPPSQYRRRTDGGPGYEVCACARKPCLIKCCKRDEVYDLSNAKCLQTSNEKLGDFAVPMLVTENVMVNAYETGMFHILHSGIICNKPYTLIPEYNDPVKNFSISKNGSLLLGSGPGVIKQSGQFCLDQVSDMKLHIAFIVCPTVEPLERLNIYHTYLMIVSLPCLLLTFLVYAMNKKLRNVYGKCLMCHVASLFIAYSSLIFIRLKGEAFPNVCVKFAYITQFSFLASFLWLHFMCYDLWLTFSEHGRIKQQYSQLKLFIIYSIQVWGFSSALSIFTYYKNTFHESDDLLYVYPEFGTTSCWFSSFTAVFVYFYLPISLVIICNLVVFIQTASLLYDKTEDSKILNQSYSNRRNDQANRQKSIFLHLSIVMGVIWLVEVMAVYLTKDYDNPSVFWLWEMTDLVNLLLGVYIFLIFVCKKHVFQLINKLHFGAQSMPRIV